MRVPSMTDEELLQAFADLGNALAVATRYGLSYKGVRHRYRDAGLVLRPGRPRHRETLPSPWDTTWADA